MNQQAPPDDDFDPAVEIEPETATRFESYLRRKIAAEQSAERARRNVQLVKAGVMGAAGVGVIVGTYKLVVSGFDGLGRLLFGKPEQP